MASIADLIKQSRADAGMTQEDLASIISCSKQAISNYETGKTVPDVPTVVSLYQALVANGGRKVGTVALWLDTLLLDGLNRCEEPADEVRGEIDSLERSVRGVHSDGRERLPHGRTLIDFPHAFDPLIVILGDRRESGVKRSNADYFVYSVSTIDVTHLLPSVMGLRSAPRIVSDKIIMYMTEDELRAELGSHNLLVVGSPAVNLFARVVNRCSVFQWDMTEHLYAVDKTMRSPELREDYWARLVWSVVDTPEKDRSPQQLRAYLDGPRSRGEWNGKDNGVSQLIDDEIERAARTASELLDGRTEKEISNMFRSMGIVDPADGRTHGTSTRQFNDFGMVSLARHPFSDDLDKCAIMVGGVHGPGTCNALRALSRSDGLNFDEHPFGGVIEVLLSERESWYKRVLNATTRWQTNPYTAAGLLGSLEDTTAGRRLSIGSTASDLQNTVEFVQHLVKADEPKV